MPRVAWDTRILKWLLDFWKIDVHLNERLPPPHRKLVNEYAQLRITTSFLDEPVLVNSYLHPSFEDRLRMVKVVHGGADHNMQHDSELNSCSMGTGGETGGA